MPADAQLKFRATGPWQAPPDSSNELLPNRSCGEIDREPVRDPGLRCLAFHIGRGIIGADDIVLCDLQPQETEILIVVALQPQLVGDLQRRHRWLTLDLVQIAQFGVAAGTGDDAGNFDRLALDGLLHGEALIVVDMTRQDQVRVSARIA